MRNTGTKPKELATHFDQIPVRVVKKLIAGQAGTMKTAPRNRKSKLSARSRSDHLDRKRHA